MCPRTNPWPAEHTRAGAARPGDDLVYEATARSRHWRADVHTYAPPPEYAARLDDSDADPMGDW